MFNRESIASYASDAAAVGDAIAGLSRQQLLEVPVPGTWSIQRIVIHLADSEQVFADRMKRVIAEENPSLMAFDQDRWMKSLDYDGQSAAGAATLIELTRTQLAAVLRSLPQSAFSREGIHSQAGPMTLAAIMEKAVGHLRHHLKFLLEKRAMVESTVAVK